MNCHRKQSFSLAGIVVLLALTVAACGLGKPDLRTTMTDGLWTYNANGANGIGAKMIISFKADGKFFSTAPVTGTPNPLNGKSEWRVDGSELTLCFAGCAVAGFSAQVAENGSFAGTSVGSDGTPVTWSLVRQQNGPTSNEPSASAVGTPSTPRVDVDSAFRGAVDLRNADGYTWRVDYSVGKIAEPQVTVANDKPGQASATAEVRGRLTVTNTTPGRNAPSLEGFQIRGLYRSDRPACQLLTGPGIIVFDLTGNDVSTLPSGGYCATRLARSSMTSDTTATLSFSHRDEQSFTERLADLTQGPDIYVLQYNDTAPITLRGPETCEMRDPQSSIYSSAVRPVVLAFDPIRPPDCTPV